MSTSTTVRLKDPIISAQVEPAETQYSDVFFHYFILFCFLLYSVVGIYLTSPCKIGMQRHYTLGWISAYQFWIWNLAGWIGLAVKLGWHVVQLCVIPSSVPPPCISFFKQTVPAQEYRIGEIGSQYYITSSQSAIQLGCEGGRKNFPSKSLS